MPLYAQINAEEEKAVKKAVFEAMASSVACQNTALKLSKLKKTKSSAMTGTATIIKEMEQELEKIKQALPDVREKAQVQAPAPKTVKTGRRTKYELELEEIKEKIANL
jgi:hypothetical protein